MSSSIWIKPRSKTGKALAKELFLPINQEADTIIRWGNTEDQSYIGREINARSAIVEASNKPNARLKLREAGLNVPSDNESDFPIIARTKRHSGGSGFWVCLNEYDLARAKARGAVYFSKFYPKTREIRVHVAGGKTLLVSEKEGDKSKVIWNHRKSEFKLRHLHRSAWLSDPRLMSMVRSAKKAVEVLGLDFGAVDIMAFPLDDQAEFVISEVNTAPALSPLALSKYANYFREVLDND